MRWFPFFILAYIALGFQEGLSGFVEVARAKPNLVLIVAVFVAAHAPRDIALIACFLLGATWDLLGAGPWGLTAFSYCIVGLVVIYSQEFVYKDHFLTHFALVLMGGFLDAIIRLLHGWVYPMIHSHAVWARPGGVSLFLGAIYTAILAVPVMFVLQRLRKGLGFRVARGQRH